MRDIVTAIEELGIDGKISIGKCTKRTVRNWVNDINRVLESNHHDWRVIGNVEDKCGMISAIPIDRYNAMKKAISDK